MTGMTITEKILAAHAGRKNVKPGELIWANVDIVLGNDITAPMAIEEFRKAGAGKVFDRNRIVLIPDHFAPNKDIKSAQQCKLLRDFSWKHRLTHYFEIGQMGIEHALLPEQGIVVPGDLVVGADSHTCTYGALGAFATGVGSTDLAAAMITGKAWFRVPESVRFVCSGRLQKWVGSKDIILAIIGRIGVDGALYQAMEFTGEAIENLSVEGRLTMCNMAIEAGAKSGIVAPDKITEKYVKPRAKRRYKIYASDRDAKYAGIEEFDFSKLEPQVASPSLPSNVKPISRVGKIPIDQVVIGSCTNGRIEDMRIASRLLKGRKVNSRVRLIVIPATQQVVKQMLKEGIMKIFLDAGAAVSTPTCGPCLGGHMGVLADGEKAVATTNRNFVGRMGNTKSEVYLAGPAVAAMSAVKGVIAAP